MKLFRVFPKSVGLTLLFISIISCQETDTSDSDEEDGLNFCGSEEYSCFCDSELRPIEIRCSGLGYKALFEEKDWKATFKALNLTGDEKLVVYFDNNDIEDITKFPQLNILSLSFKHNRVKSFQKEAFTNLPVLDTLDLSQNDLTSESLHEAVFFGKFNESNDGYFPVPFRHLNLSNNNIKSLDARTFDHFRTLQTLDLSYNPLKVLHKTANAISTLYKLEYLGLRNTSLSELPKGMLHDLEKLGGLDLSDNLFKKVPEELQYSHNLSVLILDGNWFEVLDKDSFLGLEHLEDLSISRIPTLRRVEESTFSPLKNLNKLELSFNPKLTEIDDGAFNGIMNDDLTNVWPLRQLILNDNGLTHIDASLMPWRFVDYVNIQNNPFRCDCNLEWMIKVLVERIQFATPDIIPGIICAEPKELKGRAAASLIDTPELFSSCNGGSGSIKLDDNSYEDPYQATGITFLVLGVIMILVGASILLFLVIKRRAIAQALRTPSRIRYERAETDEGPDFEISHSNNKYNSGISSVYK